MKTTPTLTTIIDAPVEITRKEAADRLNQERRIGRVMKLRVLMPVPGYVLTRQARFLGCPRLPKPPPPAAPFSLSIRLTNKYVSGWSHLDESHELGSCIVTHARPRQDDHESFRQLLIVEVTAPAYRPRNIMRAISDTMQRSCRCAHDCCGCMQSSVLRSRHLGGSRYAVIISGSRNV